VTPDAREVLDAQQIFMYIAFNDAILTDIGNTIVRRHESMYNVQGVYSDLDDHYSKSARNVVSGCFAYDDPCSSQVILLIVHQGLHITHLGYSLIPPFQKRENDIVVNDRPTFQTRSPTEDDHCVIITRDDLTTYHMPLSQRGTTSFLDVQRPTDDEI
jgi:hypothetical protein